MTRYKRTLVVGSMVGVEQSLDGYEGDLSPATLKGTSGITWDALAVFLMHGAFGVQPELIKGLATSGPGPHRRDGLCERDAEALGDSRSEVGGRPAIGSEGRGDGNVGGTVANDQLPEHVVHQTVSIGARMRGALFGFRKGDLELKALHESQEPQTLPTKAGVVAQNLHGDTVKRHLPFAVFGRHRGSSL